MVLRTICLRDIADKVMGSRSHVLCAGFLRPTASYGEEGECTSTQYDTVHQYVLDGSESVSDCSIARRVNSLMPSRARISPTRQNVVGGTLVGVWLSVRHKLSPEGTSWSLIRLRLI